MASLHFVFSPDNVSSAQTSRKISIEELNDLEIFASIVTTLPLGIGLLKLTLLTDAVTEVLFECLCAATAAIVSIQYNSLPPIKLSKLLVSFGSTISVKIARESLGNLLFIIKV